MNWAQRRQLIYMLSLIFVFLCVAGFFAYQSFNVPPTCFDGKQNGDETGVDCGAKSSCSLYCSDELSPPVVRWVRVFPAATNGASNIVHAIAYIEHGNPKAASYGVQYTFKLYDDLNSLVTERKGTTFIGAMGKSAIVETLIPIGSTDPNKIRATFSFDPIIWHKISPEYALVILNTDRKLLENTDIGTRLTATIENQSLYQFRNMEVAAILYDVDGNAITASKAVLPSLDKQESKDIVFTWGYKMPRQVVKIEVLPRFNPFTTVSI